MARSVWKGPFVDQYILKKAEAARASGRKDVIKYGAEDLQFFLNLLGLILVFIMVKSLFQF